MNEQIFLSGAPVVGFGGGNVPLTSLDKPLIGFIAGATGGAIVGALVGKKVGAVIGAVLGTIGGGAIGFAINDAHAAAPPSPEPMLPGQVWTAVGVVHPIKEWTSASKRAVEDAVTTALAKEGITLIDGMWNADYTFTVAMQPTRTPTTMLSALPLASEWADQINFSNVTRAPANARPE